MRDEPGLLAVAHADAPRRLRVRPWLAGLEDAVPGVQPVLLAGHDRGRWRWGVDVEDDKRAWLGPLSDAAPDLPLRSGHTPLDLVQSRPHAGSFPWMDAGKGRFMERPAGYEVVHLGRTWETRAAEARPRGAQGADVPPLGPAGSRAGHASPTGQAFS